jgi:Rrf2 family transcriptional regulator, nitric oxide-sensitive transcriptional repressor
MRLSMYSDFTLRVLIYLTLTGDRKATIDEIATAYDISRNHLMKVVHNLGKAGRVETSRGRSGGMRLSKSPEQINIGEVVRDCERGSALVECFGTGNKCAITPVCDLRRALGEAQEAFFAVLDGYTLADLTQRESSLSRLLAIPEFR